MRGLLKFFVALSLRQSITVPFFTDAFTLSRQTFARTSPTMLWAKKKKSPAAAALEKLDFDAFDDDAPLSKKEQKQLEKQQQKEAKAAAATAAKAESPGQSKETSKDELLAQALSNEESMNIPEPTKKLSKKELKLQKMLELEAADTADAAAAPMDEGPKLSKKELKELKKKEEKMAKKLAKKMEKKTAKQAAATGTDPDAAIPVPDMDLSIESVNGSTQESLVPPPPEKLTLEDKIRKERPPPRIRVMESSQPGYTNLRLEQVGITFRNQEVLKDVTWGVQTGDRIGLVGANGAGKTTQLRILAGELEPTTGDMVKSTKDLRVAMLRQEFVDELVPDRTLREEFMSVFEEENEILEALKTAETDLEKAGEDSDKMQEILDKMQELQDKAERKGVYALEARAQKVMDLMGFNEDEADDLVASFSGGWKMRIGLGKVLLKDPNILLLDEPTNHVSVQNSQID